jgi:hypothetical protein
MLASERTNIMSEVIVRGKIKMVGAENQVSASFKKRELVVTTDEQYPQHILINFVQDKTEYLDGLAVGQEVSVSVNLRGREWINPQGEAKYFNDIQGWRVSKDTTNGPVAPQPQAGVPNAPADSKFNQLPPNTETEDDDLPF